MQLQRSYATAPQPKLLKPVREMRLAAPSGLFAAMSCQPNCSRACWCKARVLLQVCREKMLRGMTKVIPVACMTLAPYQTKGAAAAEFFSRFSWHSSSQGEMASRAASS
jgi:hypothetical protein